MIFASSPLEGVPAREADRPIGMNVELAARRKSGDPERLGRDRIELREVR